MTGKQLVALALALHSLLNVKNPRKSAPAVKQLWDKLTGEQRNWLMPRLNVPELHDDIFKLMDSMHHMKKDVARFIYRGLSAADKQRLLLAKIAIALKVSGIGQPLPAPTGTGLVTPATMTPDGHFQTIV